MSIETVKQWKSGWRGGWFQLLVFVLVTPGLSCGGLFNKKSRSITPRDPNVVRYRLKLRENHVDSSAAFRCYGSCQSVETPGGYLDCLRECPGFEITPGLTCASYEVPPLAACFTARKVSANDELDPGWIVVAAFAGVLYVVSLASLCSPSVGAGACSPSWQMTPGPLGPTPQ